MSTISMHSMEILETLRYSGPILNDPQKKIKNSVMATFSVFYDGAGIIFIRFKRYFCTLGFWYNRKGKNPVGLDLQVMLIIITICTNSFLWKAIRQLITNNYGIMWWTPTSWYQQSRILAKGNLFVIRLNDG